MTKRFGFDAETGGKLILMPRGGAAALIDSSDPKAHSNRAFATADQARPINRRQRTLCAG
jgi:hypothetical protein